MKIDIYLRIKRVANGFIIGERDTLESCHEVESAAETKDAMLAVVRKILDEGFEDERKEESVREAGATASYPGTNCCFCGISLIGNIPVCRKCNSIRGLFSESVPPPSSFGGERA